jgi:GTPase SAR1 family protein
MKNRKNLLFYLQASIIMFVASLIAIFSLFVGDHRPVSDGNGFVFLTLSLVLSLSFATIVTYVLLRMKSRIPRYTITISIVGLPHSGKTVFITTLLNKYIVSEQDNINLYGKSTVERINHDWKILRKVSETGVWLSPTPPGECDFTYNLWKKEADVNITDYAGEMLEKELQENENHLHRTEYFKTLLKSNGIVFSVDLEAYVANPTEYVIEMESTIISTLQMIKFEKNLFTRKKTELPIALVFMKSDLVYHAHNIREIPITIDGSYVSVTCNTAKVITDFDRVITYCKSNFKYFNHFFVSSLNEINDKSSDDEDIRKPFEWIFGKI